MSISPPILILSNDNFKEEVASGRIVIVGPSDVDIDGDDKSDTTTNTKYMNQDEILNTVQDAIRGLVNKAQQGEINSIVVYYLSHGDGWPRDLGDDFFAESMTSQYPSRIQEYELLQAFAGLPANTYVQLLVEACYSGKLHTGHRLSDLNKNTLVFSSAGETQKANTLPAILTADLVFPSLLNVGGNWGEAIERGYQQFTTVSGIRNQNPMVQSGGNPAYKLTEKDSPTFPSGELGGKNVGVRTAVTAEGDSSSLNRVFFTDTVSNFTSDTVTNTLTIKTAQGYEVIAPKELVLSANEQASFTFQVQLPHDISASDYITATVDLMEQSGLHIELLNQHFPSEDATCLVINPAENPASYIEEGRGIRIKVPVLNMCSGERSIQTQFSGDAIKVVWDQVSHHPPNQLSNIEISLPYNFDPKYFRLIVAFYNHGVMIDELPLRSLDDLVKGMRTFYLPIVVNSEK